MINISASDLIKKSSKTICYFRNKKANYPVSERMLRGCEEAERKSVSEYKEMRGCYEHPFFLLFYSFDEIIPGKPVQLIEHKNIEQGSIIEDWYVNSCILQVALYHSLAMKNPCKKYYTAKFFCKQGHETKYLDLAGQPIKSVLKLGNTTYYISVKKPDKIVDFYFEKATTTFEYFTAINWDIKWKFKEWEHLKKYVIYTKTVFEEDYL